MARTDPLRVQAVLGRDYDAKNKPDLAPYIATASSFVDDVVSHGAAKGLAFSDDRLELIERWLSAHCYCTMDKPYQSRSTQGASGSFQGQVGKGFESSNYGLMALRLDTSGTLEAIDKRKVAGAKWAGKTSSEALTARERGYT